MLNKAQIIGRLGQDPQSRFMPDGTQVVSLSIATSEAWKNKDGEKQERTEWHRIQLWGKVADIAAQYLTKGALVYIEGSLRTRKWQDKDGQDHYTTEIRGDVLKMLGRKAEEGAASSTGPASAPGTGPAKAGTGTFADLEDDIPF